MDKYGVKDLTYTDDVLTALPLRAESISNTKNLTDLKTESCKAMNNNIQTQENLVLCTQNHTTYKNTDTIVHLNNESASQLRNVDQYCVKDLNYMNDYFEIPQDHGTAKNSNSENFIGLKTENLKSCNVVNNNMKVYENNIFNTQGDAIYENTVTVVDLKKESHFENVASKIEITEHSLGLETIQALEDIHRQYDENIINKRSNLNRESSDFLGNNVKKIKGRKKNMKRETEENNINKKRSLEKFERLFIRLERIDISKKKLHIISKNNRTFKVKKNSDQNTKKEAQKNDNSLSKKQNLTNMPKKLIKLPLVKKKTMRQLVINKTESVKLEEILLKSLSKKESNSVQRSDNFFTAHSHSNDSVTREPTDGIIAKKFIKISKNQDTLPGKKIDEICEEDLPVINKKKYTSMEKNSDHRSIGNSPKKVENSDKPVKENQNKRQENIKGSLIPLGGQREIVQGKNILKAEYQCYHCNKVLRYRKSFIFHLKRMHGKKEKNFQCPTHNFTTNVERSLEKHVFRAHIPGDKKPTFICNICEIFETKYKVDLQTHMDRVHMKRIKMNKCDCATERDPI